MDRPSWPNSNVLEDLSMIHDNLTARQVAKVFLVPESRIWKWLDKGWLKPVLRDDTKGGFIRIFKKKDLMAMVRMVDPDDPRHPNYNEGDNE
jgi:hypothetical protein